jgi:hypothetical protein
MHKYYRPKGVEPDYAPLRPRPEMTYADFGPLMNATMPRPTTIHVQGTASYTHHFTFTVPGFARPERRGGDDIDVEARDVTDEPAPLALPEAVE